MYKDVHEEKNKLVRVNARLCETYKWYRSMIIQPNFYRLFQTLVQDSNNDLKLLFQTDNYAAFKF